MATYLLTGATGFLGGHLLRKLIASGHDVVVLSRKPLPHLEHDKIRVVVGDILDASSVEHAAEGCEALFHCAGMVSRDPKDAKQMMEINVQGTIRTLDATKKAGVRRVVYLSTSGTIAISEDGKEWPNEQSATPYGLIGRWGYYRSKMYAEAEALKRNGENFEVICLNPSLLLGPGDVRGSSTQDIRWFLQKKVPAIPSGGLSFVDVRDVADACIQAMKRGKAGERYLLGGCNLSFVDYFGRLERVSGVEAPLLRVPKYKTLSSIGNALFLRFQESFGSQDGPDEVSLEQASYFWYLDATYAQRQLHFTPRDPLETLQDTIDDLREWDPFLSSNNQDQTLRMKYHLLEGLSILETQAKTAATVATHAVKEFVQSRNDSMN